MAPRQFPPRPLPPKSHVVSAAHYRPTDDDLNASTITKVINRLSSDDVVAIAEKRVADIAKVITDLQGKLYLLEQEREFWESVRQLGHVPAQQEAEPES